MKKYTNCVSPQGKFTYGIHKPSYKVANLRDVKKIDSLGVIDTKDEYLNTANYPDGNIDVERAKWIFEIPNPLPFRGATFIDKGWADAAASDYSKMHLPQSQDLSFNEFLQSNNLDIQLLERLPRQLLLSLATCSSDADDLKRLAEMSCDCIHEENGRVTGLRYHREKNGRISAIIRDHDLFEAVANNPYLPDDYAQAMVLRPGAQGLSEIVGDWNNGDNSHIYEYLRRNSYIAGGHYAANMADDARRYSIMELTADDMFGLRHLYYQRMYVKIARILGIDADFGGSFTSEDLEKLRLKLLESIESKNCCNAATLWGWNFGFDYSPTDYRLHASHQQIHQQYALIPEKIGAYSSGTAAEIGSMQCYCSGDLIATAIDEYQRHHGSDLFTDYFTAMKCNKRMDDREDLSHSLIVWEDGNVAIIVPKAQTSQWELQIITKPDANWIFPGNIVETDTQCRRSLDIGILKAQQAFAKLGAKMVTSMEFSKRVAERNRSNQPLIYSLLPKLPFSPGAFSEAHLRFINGHYPEDFAALCRNQLENLES